MAGSSTQSLELTMQITEVLARRTDLSTFLVHLSRAAPGASAKDNLISILQSGRIQARSPYGMAARRLQNVGIDAASQKSVCFTETPLKHVNLLSEEIENRAFRFEPYGIGITRKQGRMRGVNPVWYLDITPGHDWLTQPINRLIDQAIESGAFDDQDIARVAPFIEQMGSGPGNAEQGLQPYRKEFWWEREWRHVGDFHLPGTFIVLCPSAEIPQLQAVIDALGPLEAPNRVSYLDPTWSLEMIIGKLAGFGGGELGPF